MTKLKLVLILLTLIFINKASTQCDYTKAHYFNESRKNKTSDLIHKIELLKNSEQRSKLNLLPSLGVQANFDRIGPIISWNPSSLLINKSKKARLELLQLEALQDVNMKILRDSIEILKTYLEIEKLKTLHESYSIASDSLSLKIDYLTHLNPVDTLTILPTRILEHKKIKLDRERRAVELVYKVKDLCYKIEGLIF